MKSNGRKDGNLPLQDLLDAIQGKDPDIEYGDIAEKIGRSNSSLSRSLRRERDGIAATRTLINLIKSKYELLLTGKKTHSTTVEKAIRHLEEKAIRGEVLGEMLLTRLLAMCKDPVTEQRELTKKYQKEVAKRLDAMRS